MAVEQEETYPPRLAPGPYPLSQLLRSRSPKMQPSYAYPPPQGQPPPDHFRHSPSASASNATLPPVSLPPLRSIDGQQSAGGGPHPPPPQLLPQGAGQQGGQTIPSIHGYYAHGPPGMQHPGAVWPNNPRYAAIPQGQSMAAGRGKKEIKRRTKTGCLTCRKRRIKVRRTLFHIYPEVGFRGGRELCEVLARSLPLVDDREARA